MNIRLKHDVSLYVCGSKMVTYRYSREQRNLMKQRESNSKNVRLVGITGIIVAPEWKAAPPTSWLGSIIQHMISRKD